MDQKSTRDGQNSTILRELKVRNVKLRNSAGWKLCYLELWLPF